MVFNTATEIIHGSLQKYFILNKEQIVSPKAIYGQLQKLNTQKA